MEMYVRKRKRLREYDYTSPGTYLITICTDNMALTLTESDAVTLTHIGNAVRDGIITIPDHYEFVSVDKWVIMPNHIHMILVLKPGNKSFVSEIVRQMKSAITKVVGHPVFAYSYHDHIICNDDDYREICQVVSENPQRWVNDPFHPGRYKLFK